MYVCIFISITKSFENPQFFDLLLVLLLVLFGAQVEVVSEELDLIKK